MNLKKVWDLIKKLPCNLIKGNHENLLYDASQSKEKSIQIQKKYGIGHLIAIQQFNETELEELFSLKSQKSLRLGSLSIQLNHGSPWNQSAYLYPDTPIETLEKANSAHHDIILVGHSHYPFIKKLSFSVLINPGSVGQNRLTGGVANWALIDTEKKDYLIMNTLYSVKKLSKSVLKNDPKMGYNYNILFR